MDEPYTIGTVARLAEVGTETIRFYERKGLIQPPPRNASGYRIYTADVVKRIRFIRDCRNLGFSLAEVRMLLRGHEKEPATCGAVKQLLLTKAREIEVKLQEMRMAQQALDRLIRLCPATAKCLDCHIAQPIPEHPAKP